MLPIPSAPVYALVYFDMPLYILTVDLAHLNTLNVCLKYTLLEKEAPVYQCLTEEKMCLMICSTAVVQKT